MSAAPSADSPAPHRVPAWLRAVVLVVALLLVYRTSLQGEYVYDDLLVVESNPQIASFEHLPQLFSSSYWDFLDQDEAKLVGYYRPLTMVLMTAAWVFGGGDPWAFHALSLAVFALACLAAWRLAVRITRDETVGFAGGLLFALHPLHVESVAWISALHDCVFALFGFLALNAFLRWRDARAGGAPWAAGVWFLLALLSKDAAVAILPLAVALDLGRRVARRSADAGAPAPRLLPTYAPLALALVAYWGVRVAVFGDLMAGFDRSTTGFGVGFARLASLRLELFGGALGLLAWPAELNLFRPFQPELPAGALTLWVAAGATLLFAGLALWAWLRRCGTALALLLFVPAGIAPLLLRANSVGAFPLSDRFLFVSVLGFTTLLAWVSLTRLPRHLGIAVVVLAALGYGVRGALRVADWHDEERLFRTAVAQNPRNPNVYWGLGRVLLTRYGERRQPDDLREAHRCFDTAMDLLAESTQGGTDIFATDDDFLQTNLGLGWALLYETEFDPFHDYATPRVVFDRVIQKWPDNERGWIGRGMTWLEAGDPNEAGRALRRALELNDKSPEAHFDMGLLMVRIEEWETAATHFRRSAELRNGAYRDLVFLARALLEAGHDQDAVDVAGPLHARNPRDPDPLVMLGIAAAKGGRPAEALQRFDEAIAVSPEYGPAYLHRGKALIALDRRKEAVQALGAATELLPQSFEAHYNLASLLLDSNQPEAALQPFLVAYRLRPKGELEGLLSRVAEQVHRNDPVVLLMLATIDNDRGDYEPAEHWARKVLELEPDHAQTKFLLGMLLKQRKQYVEAYDYLHEAADALKDSFTAQMEFAEVLLQTQQELAAKPYFERALALLPKQTDMAPELRLETSKRLRTALEEIAKLEPSAGPSSSD
ncbi:MAG: tetratricopeptide repeat protein [Planctomycetes bacterium]|nr:tetratricopeptide repeat protein [Planctomycetota bacterium]